MNQNKTRPTQGSVASYLDIITPAQKQEDCRWLHQLMERLTGEKAVLWGSSILGYGSYHYRYKSGREGDWFLCGFDARKKAISLYLLCDLNHKDLDFTDLGNYKKGVGCLYIKQLQEVSQKKLETLVAKAIEICRRKAVTPE
ncbi:MAG: DUF1801 domain-containing protein [Flavobacteriaceae bacterium]